MSDFLILQPVISYISPGNIIDSLFPHATPPVMLGSLAGTALYVLSRRNHELWKQGAFAVISFVGGVYSADMSSEILGAVLNSSLQRLAPELSVTVPPPVGSLFASAVSVSVLLRTMSYVKSNALNL